jgi:hypothetical protein
MQFRNSLIFSMALLFVSIHALGCGGGSHGPSVLTVTTTSLPGGVLGTTYTTTLSAANGTPPYTWTELSGGALPGGLALTGSTGVITGTPTAVGTFGPYVFQVTDSANGTASSQSLSIAITATTTAACATRGNETALTATAPFAFLVEGVGSSPNPIAIAGSFTPNGDGTIKAAAADYNGFTTGFEPLAVNLAMSSYSFGTDNRGCLSLAVSEVQAAAKTFRKAASAPQFRKASARNKRNKAAAAGNASAPATITFSFVLGEKTGSGFQSGRIIEFDDTATSGSFTAGMLHVQTPSAFKLTSLQSNYAFGVDGWDPVFNRIAVAGTFINTSGTLSGGVGDYNDLGLTPPVSGELDGGTGTLSTTTIDTTTGRGTGSISLPLGQNTFLAFDFTFYVVNGSDFYLISTDSPSDAADSSGLLTGQALATKASFTPGSLNGSYLLAGLGFDPTAIADIGAGNVAEIGNFQASSGGTIAGGNVYVNDAGSFATQAISGGTYLTQTSGRTTVTATGSGAPIAYLTAPSSDENIIAFFVGTDPLTTSGAGYLQTTAQTPGFSAMSLDAPFVMGTDEDVDGGNGGIDGVFTFDGSSKYTAVIDNAFLGLAPAPGQTTSGTFTVKADGSGTLSLAGGSLVILTNGTQIFAIDQTGSSDSAIDPLLYVFTIESQPD